MTYKQALEKLDKTVVRDLEFKIVLSNALVKQIPKRPVMKANGWDLYTCPNCDKGIINNNDDGKFPYCHLCGQALDWSDAE